MKKIKQINNINAESSIRYLQKVRDSNINTCPTLSPTKPNEDFNTSENYDTGEQERIRVMYGNSRISPIKSLP